MWLKGGTTDPQFNLVVHARNLPEKLQFMVPPDGDLEFKKISLVDSTIDSGPYQSCDSDSEDSGDSESSDD